MSEATQISLLMRRYGVKMHELEFILRYLSKEGMTPQLLVRRIEAYDKLMKKLETDSPADKMKTMQAQAEHAQTRLSDAETETTVLEQAKLALEVKLETKENEIMVLKSTVEELQRQFSLAASMQAEGVDDALQVQLAKDLQMAKAAAREYESTKSAAIEAIIGLRGKLSSTPSAEWVADSLLLPLKALIENGEVVKMDFTVPDGTTPPPGPPSPDIAVKATAPPQTF